MLRTGKEHLETLRDGRVVYIGSERVADVTTHPAFAGAARSIAMLTPPRMDMWAPKRIFCVISSGVKRSREISRYAFGKAASGLLRDVSTSLDMTRRQNTLGCQSGFFKLPVPAYSKSLYIGVSNTPGPFMFKRKLKSSLSSRK